MDNTFMRYIMGGALSIGIKFVITYTAVNFFDFWYFYPYLVSLFVVIIVNFIINSFFIFQVKDFKVARISSYLISIFLFNSVDAYLVLIFTDVLSFYYLWSIGMATGLVFIIKYSIFNNFIFYNRKFDYLKNKNNVDVFSSDNYLKEHDKPYLKGYESLVVKKYFKLTDQILDLGCGAGRTTKALNDMSYNIIGVDISDSLIDLAKQKYPNLDFRVGDACHLDFPDNYFDVVFFSFNGLDYIYPKNERTNAILDIHRVLKNGGLFIYSSHNALNIPRTKISAVTFLNSLLTLKIFTAYRIEKHQMGSLVTYYGNILSEKVNLQKAGFNLIDSVGVGRFSNTKNKFVLSLFSKHIMYIFKKGK